MKISSKDEIVTDNSLIRKYVSKIENRIVFKIKTGYYFQLLAMNLINNAKSKITKDKYYEMVPHLKITEEVLVHCNTVNNDISTNCS